MSVNSNCIHHVVFVPIATKHDENSPIIERHKGRRKNLGRIQRGKGLRDLRQKKKVIELQSEREKYQDEIDEKKFILNTKGINTNLIKKEKLQNQIESYGRSQNVINRVLKDIGIGGSGN